MAEAAFWGFVGASALIVAAEVAFRFELPAMAVGLIMAFGVGTLISSIAFELVEPALELVDGPLVLVIGLLAGSVVFFLGDRAVSNMGGARRRHRGREDRPESSGLGIVLGTILDGVPESVVLGMSLVTLGEVGPALLVAIWVSNFPESLGATVDMRAAGRSKGLDPGSLVGHRGHLGGCGRHRLRAPERDRRVHRSDRAGLRRRSAADDDRR